MKKFEKGKTKRYSITPELSYTYPVQFLSTGQISSVTRTKDKKYGSTKALPNPRSVGDT